MPHLTPLSLMETVNTHQYILKILPIPKNSILELVEEWIKTTIHTQEDFLLKKFQTLHTMPQLIPLSSMETVNIHQYILKTSLIQENSTLVLVVVSTKTLTHTQEVF